MSLLKLEDEAIAIARRIGREPPPPDAGLIGQLANVVRDARQEGYDQAVREVVDAYRLFIETDDLDGFRDTITDMMPSEDRPVSRAES